MQLSRYYKPPKRGIGPKPEYSKLPMRILLILFVWDVFALFVLGNLPLLYSWALFVVAGLGLAMLFSMGLLGAYHRLDPGLRRKVLMFLCGFLAFLSLYLAYTMSQLWASGFEQIMGIYPSPEGSNKLAVVRSPAFGEGEDENDSRTKYSAWLMPTDSSWPFLNDYLAFRIDDAEGAYSIVTDSFVFDVEWLTEDLARVSVPYSGSDEAAESMRFEIDFRDFRADAESGGP